MITAIIELTVRGLSDGSLVAKRLARVVVGTVGDITEAPLATETN